MDGIDRDPTKIILKQLTLAAIALIASTVSAQPNLTGTWQLTAGALHGAMYIQQTVLTGGMFPIGRTGTKLDYRARARQTDGFLASPQLKGDRGGATLPLYIGDNRFQPSVAEQSQLIK